MGNLVRRGHQGRGPPVLERWGSHSGGKHIVVEQGMPQKKVRGGILGDKIVECASRAYQESDLPRLYTIARRLPAPTGTNV